MIKTRKPLDRDIFDPQKSAKFGSISVECTVENSHGTKRTVNKDVEIEILDEDDNAPRAQEKRLDITIHSDRVFKVGLCLIYGDNFISKDPLSVRVVCN